MREKVVFCWPKVVIFMKPSRQKVEQCEGKVEQISSNSMGQVIFWYWHLQPFLYSMQHLQASAWFPHMIYPITPSTNIKFKKTLWLLQCKLEAKLTPYLVKQRNNFELCWSICYFHPMHFDLSVKLFFAMYERKNCNNEHRPTQHLKIPKKVSFSRKNILILCIFAPKN